MGIFFSESVIVTEEFRISGDMRIRIYKGKTYDSYEESHKFCKM